MRRLFQPPDDLSDLDRVRKHLDIPKTSNNPSAKHPLRRYEFALAFSGYMAKLERALSQSLSKPVSTAPRIARRLDQRHPDWARSAVWEVTARGLASADNFRGRDILGKYELAVSLARYVRLLTPILNTIVKNPYPPNPKEAIKTVPTKPGHYAHNDVLFLANGGWLTPDSAILATADLRAEGFADCIAHAASRFFVRYIHEPNRD